MPVGSLTWSNRRHRHCLPNLFGFTDFQKSSTCTAASTRPIWTARRSRNRSESASAAAGIGAGNAAAITLTRGRPRIELRGAEDVAANLMGWNAFMRAVEEP